jgi:MoxR-like ATPase
MEPTDIKKRLKALVSKKPDTLIISDLKWKYLCRNVIRGKNILILGPTGCGKTLAVNSVGKLFVPDENYFCFNLGSTQDARVSLIGNTNFDKATGTVFNESKFVSAIRTENAIILLDEISRAHPDAWNILMSVLDPIQRYLRLDEHREGEIVKVAKGVTFLATANVGNEYTSTKVMDRALLNRFNVKIEMEPLGLSDEFNLLKNRLSITDETELETLNALLKICEHTRNEIKKPESKLSNFISTRDAVEMAELIVDGFSLVEIAENVIYPNFEADGGVDSERTFVKQIVQKYVAAPNLPKTLFPSSGGTAASTPVPDSKVPF